MAGVWWFPANHRRGFRQVFGDASTGKMATNASDIRQRIQSSVSRTGRRIRTRRVTYCECTSIKRTDMDKLICWKCGRPMRLTKRRLSFPSTTDRPIVHRVARCPKGHKAHFRVDLDEKAKRKIKWKKKMSSVQ